MIHEKGLPLQAGVGFAAAPRRPAAVREGRFPAEREGDERENKRMEPLIFTDL